MQECLCALVVDDSEEVSAAAQEFLENSLLSGGKTQLQLDIAEIFSRYVLHLVFDCMWL